jgi:hypothetical protein
MMFRKVLGIATFVMLLSGVAGMGCGGGYSDEKAAQRCQQEKDSKAQCVTSAAQDACLSCYKSCGDQCTAQATCPETYECE